MNTIAAIWDLNGVIIDDMRFHLQALQIYLATLGYEMTEEYFYANCTGATPQDVFSKILPPLGNPVSIAHASKSKSDVYFEVIKGKMEMLPGAADMIRGLNAIGIKQSIASGTTNREVAAILKEFEIDDCFDAIVAAEDVIHGKPDPEPFLTAAQRLGIEPGRCVVFEDGEFGVRAAKCAGMKVIAITNTQTREELSAADVIVDSLADVSTDDVIALANDQIASTAK